MSNPLSMGLALCLDVCEYDEISNPLSKTNNFYFILSFDVKLVGNWAS